MLCRTRRLRRHARSPHTGCGHRPQRARSRAERFAGVLQGIQTGVMLPHAVCCRRPGHKQQWHGQSAYRVTSSGEAVSRRRAASAAGRRRALTKRCARRAGVRPGHGALAGGRRPARRRRQGERRGAGRRGRRARRQAHGLRRRAAARAGAPAGQPPPRRLARLRPLRRRRAARPAGRLGLRRSRPRSGGGRPRGARQAMRRAALCACERIVLPLPLWPHLGIDQLPGLTRLWGWGTWVPRFCGLRRPSARRSTAAAWAALGSCADSQDDEVSQSAGAQCERCCGRVVTEQAGAYCICGPGAAAPSAPGAPATWRLRQWASLRGACGRRRVEAGSATAPSRPQGMQT